VRFFRGPISRKVTILKADNRSQSWLYLRQFRLYQSSLKVILKIFHKIQNKLITLFLFDPGLKHKLWNILVNINSWFIVLELFFQSPSSLNSIGIDSVTDLRHKALWVVYSKMKIAIGFFLSSSFKLNVRSKRGKTSLITCEKSTLECSYSSTPELKHSMLELTYSALDLKTW